MSNTLSNRDALKQNTAGNFFAFRLSLLGRGLVYVPVITVFSHLYYIEWNRDWRDENKEHRSIGPCMPLFLLCYLFLHVWLFKKNFPLSIFFSISDFYILFSLKKPMRRGETPTVCISVDQGSFIET